MSGCIYKIENMINGKVYVGQSVDAINRKRTHERELERGANFNKHLQNSYEKYGKSNFAFFILADCDTEELDELERYWIEYYNSNDERFGYNKTLGGNVLRGSDNFFFGKRYVGESNPFYGKMHTEEAKKRMSEQRKGLFAGKKNYFYGKSFKGEDHPRYGKKHTEEAKRKMRENISHKKITDEQVESIIYMLLETDLSAKEISDIYGMTTTEVSAIKNNRRRKHILPELREELKQINMFERRSKRNKNKNLSNEGVTTRRKP